MSDHEAKRWWESWAPFWQPFEDRHFGIAAVERSMRAVASPVLVIGAGQGILVEHLARRGHDVVGLDASEAMVAAARRRRKLDIVLGDARRLPFEEERFRTVLIASGVVDYVAESDVAAHMIAEAVRVLRPWGNVLCGFYRFPSKLERVYRNIGVIVEDRYHTRRLFELGELARKSPFRCVPPIARWTGRGTLATAIYWANTGVTMRKVFKRESRALEEVMSQAARAGLGREQLLAEVPDVLPYRTEEHIRALFDAAGLRWVDLTVLDDCVVARHQKSGDRGESEAGAGEQGGPGSASREGDPPTALGRPTPAVRRSDRSAASARDEAPPHIQTSAVRKRYRGARRDAVRSLDLRVERGSIFGILGPNGAGKTTTLMMLCGLLAPDAGTIRYAGDRSPDVVRAHIGLVPQNIALYANLSARENLRFFGKLHGLRGSALRERTEELLSRIDLTDRADDRVDTYSGGMKRRLNLVTGLVHKPEILLLDEPTVGMDPQSRNRVFEMVERLRDDGVTVLYTTHYMEEASRLCDRVAIMDHGTVLVEGSPAELVARIGSSRVELVVPDAPSELRADLDRLDGVMDVVATDEGLAVTTRDSSDALRIIDEARALAAAHGASLSLRSLVGASLETVFLELTGRSMRDEAE